MRLIASLALALAATALTAPAPLAAPQDGRIVTITLVRWPFT